MSDTKSKTTSSWILHVKKFASDNGLKYNEALKDKRLREGYVSTAKPKKEREFKLGDAVDCTEHGPKNSFDTKPKKAKKSNEPMVERPQSPAPLTVKSVKVASKRQSTGKGRDLTQPEVPIMMDESGTLNTNLIPTKKGRKKKEVK